MRNAAALILAALAALAALVPSVAAADLVRVEEVRVRMTDAGPVVLLAAGGAMVPIFVDFTVAASIQGALGGERTHRPMTHDLVRGMLERLGVRVTRTVISLKGDTYLGALDIAQGERRETFDARASDSIALALHFEAPILVGRELLRGPLETPFEKKPGAL